MFVRHDAINKFQIRLNVNDFNYAFSFNNIYINPSITSVKISVIKVISRVFLFMRDDLALSSIRNRNLDMIYSSNEARRYYKLY
jgi:hypothetical protein